MSTTETSSGNFAKVVGDMSTSFRGAWIYLGPGAKHISLEVSWTGTGSPIGAFTLEVANDSLDASGAVLPATSAAAFVAQQPAGSAGSVFLDNIPTAALYVAPVYTRSSAGTGAVATITIGRMGA